MSGLLTLNPGTVLFLALVAVIALGKWLGDDVSEDEKTEYHDLAGTIGLGGFVLLVTAPVTEVAFHVQAGVALFMFVLAAGLMAIGDIRENGRVKNSREMSGAVPDDPTEILDRDDGE